MIRIATKVPMTLLSTTLYPTIRKQVRYEYSALVLI